MQSIKIILRKQFISGVQAMYAYLMFWSFIFGMFTGHTVLIACQQTGIIGYTFAIIFLAASLMLIADSIVTQMDIINATLYRNKKLFMYIFRIKDKLHIIGAVWFILLIANINIKDTEDIVYVLFYSSVAIIGLSLAIRDGCVEYNHKIKKE